MKPGYQLQVTSWENDGDNYKTEITSGLTEDELRLRLFICAAFGFDHGGNIKLDYSPVSGNDENRLGDLVELWNMASAKFPAAAAKVYLGGMPTEEDVDLYEERRRLRYNDASRNDPHYMRAVAAVDPFLGRFTDFVQSLVSHPSEGYDEMDYYFRYAETVKVFYIPSAIEDVTSKFINQEGKLI